MLRAAATISGINAAASQPPAPARTLARAGPATAAQPGLLAAPYLVHMHPQLGAVQLPMPPAVLVPYSMFAPPLAAALGSGAAAQTPAEKAREARQERKEKLLALRRQQRPAVRGQGRAEGGQPDGGPPAHAHPEGVQGALSAAGGQPAGPSAAGGNKHRGGAGTAKRCGRCRHLTKGSTHQHATCWEDRAACPPCAVCQKPMSEHESPCPRPA